MAVGREASAAAVMEVGRVPKFFNAGGRQLERRGEERRTASIGD